MRDNQPTALDIRGYTIEQLKQNPLRELLVGDPSIQLVCTIEQMNAITEIRKQAADQRILLG